MAGRRRVRIMTYNVHRCLGADGTVSPERIADVIIRHEPDVVALQELDIGRARTGHHDQPELIARSARMRHAFFPAIEAAHERYGDAILTRFPLDLVRCGSLPTVAFSLERRGALWVQVDCDGLPLQVLNTHLGLGRRERLVQIEALVGRDWLGDATCQAPRVFCGDFNTWPGTQAYGRLRQVLHNAQDRGRHTWWRNTFPSRCPMVCIDHVMHSPDLKVRSVEVLRTRLTRVASDHLPLVVEFTLP
jgi:endonuclease/exonuclease/phosphatase family metal-dependent hydrolase